MGTGIRTYICIVILVLAAGMQAMGQESHQMVRLAKLTIDPAKLSQYNQVLKEQMTTAIRVEPGVLTYYAVAEKKDPAKITILEIYADTLAYQSHIRTPHFLKYKETVKDWVLSLELVDVALIAASRKPD